MAYYEYKPVQQSEILIHSDNNCPSPVTLAHGWGGNMHTVSDDCILGWFGVTVEFTEYVAPAGKTNMAHRNFKPVRVCFDNAARPMTKSILMGKMLDEYLRLAKDHVCDFPSSDEGYVHEFVWGLRRDGDIYRPIVG